MKDLRLVTMALHAVMALSAHLAMASQPNTPGRYAPRNTCAALPGEAAFRSSLATAVRGRDARALVALAAKDITLDFGGGAGREELLRRLSGSAGHDLWRALDRVLVLGCAYQDGAMVMPWFFAQDLGNIDPFAVRLVTGNGVALRAGPQSDAPVTLYLSWQLVEPRGKSTDGWQQVGLPDSEVTGFIADRFLRSPIDYRLIASRQGRNWKITAIVAGD